MNKTNRRQFIKTSTAAGMAGLIAPSFFLSSCTNTKSEVLLIIAKVKVSLRIAYWDKSKIWHPLELVQDGNTVKSKGPVNVIFSFIDEGQYLTYNLDVQSPEPTRIGLFLSLPGTTSETPVYHVLPGLLFGDNNLANVLDKNAFHHLTNEPFEGKAFSPVWEFRADRCAMPLSAMCSEKAIIAISIDPYAESDEPTTVACGVTSMLADDVAPASCGVTLGYANLPYTYPYQGSFTPSVQEQLKIGKVSGRIYAEATGDRRSVNRFVREEYK
ncbi:MAG: twin-arginine translocation signal domain-containing protein, partial [Bacteroidales bacterium]|nr:twin-arginine translocation signal domain-containing protein [Bacteroidales bacterium]